VTRGGRIAGVVGWVCAVGALAACFGVARRAGGGSDPPPSPPSLAAALSASASGRASASGAASAKPAPVAKAPGDAAFEVTHRLVDTVHTARFDGNPSLASVALGPHWRKMTPPWVPFPEGSRRLVTSIALRMSASETQWSVNTQAGKAWQPDARVWNMNEGSFDQRDALVAAAPSTFTFKLDVPEGARFVFAPGTVNATGEATLFSVSVVDARGAAKEVALTRVAPADARRWGEEVHVDLAAYAGQTVELKLATRTEPARPGEKTAPPTPKVVKKGDDDAAPPPEPGLMMGSASVALWANPTVLRRAASTKIPYNVLWIVIDALRPDVLASFHDDEEDARRARSAHPPLEAALPKIPGLTPVLDELTKRGVRYTHAYSAGAWTRPGTLSMLSGARSSELGIETTSWVLPPQQVSRFYGSQPPLLPLLLRRDGVVTRAFVNNYFMVGYAPVGVDVGFERTDDHRYRTRDTLEVTRDATAWIRANKDTRFFAFCNYNSPHEPWEPPDRFMERVPPPPHGPKDSVTRRYMAEAAKDDEAVGQLLATLDETGLRERTIIVVTADHGETLSAAHTGTGMDNMPIRYHHAASNFEETTRIPILIVAPGRLPEGREVAARVRNTDIVPTLVELMGMEPSPRMSGRSLVALSKSGREEGERVVVSEGRATRAIISGHHRLLVREVGGRLAPSTDDRGAPLGSESLYDLDADPGERQNLAARDPATLREMRARLEAALKNVPTVGTPEARAPSGGGADADKKPVIHLRFATRGEARRVSGTITVGKGKVGKLDPVGLDPSQVRDKGDHVELGFTTAEDAVVGLDLLADPPAAPVTWQLYLDDKPWPEVNIFAGGFGLFSPVVAKGLVTDDAREAAAASLLPQIHPRRDLGLFVARDRGAIGVQDGAEITGEGADEMNRLLQEWGYAQGPAKGKPKSHP